MLNYQWPHKIPVLETDLLDLRPILLEHAADYFEICSNPKVMQTWGTPCHQSIAETERLINFLNDQFVSQQMIRWGIFEKGKNKLIGDVGFWRMIPFRLSAESGAKLAPEFWGKNYMPEALGRVIDYGFKDIGLNSVEGNIDPENKGSLRLVEKLGYTYIGKIPQYSFCGWRKTFIDSEHFMLGKQEWNNPYA
jgi:ribosomal-protein-alanine N-acetyltransferase